MKKVVGDMSEWSGMLKDLFRQINDESISRENLQLFLEHKNPFAILDPREEWWGFYNEFFGIDVDFSGVRIPDDPGGFCRIIGMTPNFSAQHIFDVCNQNFTCWKHAEDLIVQSDRTTENGPYFIRVRDRVEADEELKNLSANALKNKCIPGITLEERLIFALKSFKETGKHLDIENWTLCSGSRFADGDVPSVDWGRISREMCVSWCSPDSAGSGLRARQAVS